MVSLLVSQLIAIFERVYAYFYTYPSAFYNHNQYYKQFICVYIWACVHLASICMTRGGVHRNQTLAGT